MSAELEYSIVDVFTSTALSGNPLAVVVDTIGLATDGMQSIAREFNLSETTFIQRRSAELERTEGVRVRIFTTQEELPFAGHPTLGTASVLRTIAPEMVVDNTITLALNVGPIRVKFGESPHASAGTFGEMTQRDPEFGAELDSVEVAGFIGVNPADIDLRCPPQTVSTGTAFAIVVLQSMDALARVAVNHPKSTPWLRERGARWFYILAPTGVQQPAFRARMQFYGGEDPATGSAAGCAISHLVARGVVESGCRIHVQQGVEIVRPSDLFLSAKTDVVKVTDVRVGGSTVLVAKGHLFLP